MSYPYGGEQRWGALSELPQGEMGLCCHSDQPQEPVLFLKGAFKPQTASSLLFCNSLGQHS